jgi:hypothetical protein
MIKKILSILYKYFNICFHPSYALQVFHFTHFTEPNIKYDCNYICGICATAVRLPICNKKGLAKYFHEDDTIYKTKYMESDKNE